MPVRSSPLLLLGEKEKLIVFFCVQNSFSSSQKITKKIHAEISAKIFARSSLQVQDRSIKALFYGVTVTFG
jgi:hypothetical protein